MKLPFRKVSMKKSPVKQKPKASKPPKREKTVSVKRVKTASLQLTLEELIHIRDIMSVRLPTNVKSTLSESLAKTENREFIESRLWQKVADICRASKIPLDGEAPDYVITLAAVPELGVFPVEINEDYVVEERADSHVDEKIKEEKEDSDEVS